MFRKTVKLALLFVYLVIIAGAIVRMTGSGMGCPDWPKCFGYLIPPTNRAQLQWHPNKSFDQGQIIIKNDSLKVAATDFTTKNTYDPENWRPYEKENYAKFNAFKTWVEFINRLFGMLSGIFVFIMAIAATLSAILTFKNYRKRTLLLSWLSVGLIGLEAWLGAYVVYTVLAPYSVTIHMAMSYLILGVLLYLLFIADKKPHRIKYDRQFQSLMALSLVLTLAQIFMGTQVRQFVDIQVKLLGENAQNQWLSMPGIWFYIHRSFSIVILVLNGFLWWKNRKSNLKHSQMNSIMALIFLEILIGIAMYYFDFPFLSQPLHLTVSLLLFSVQFYVLLQSRRVLPKLKTA